MSATNSCDTNRDTVTEPAAATPAKDIFSVLMASARSPVREKRKKKARYVFDRFSHVLFCFMHFSSVNYLEIAENSSDNICKACNSLPEYTYTAAIWRKLQVNIFEKFVEGIKFCGNLPSCKHVHFQGCSFYTDS